MINVTINIRIEDKYLAHLSFAVAMEAAWKLFGQKHSDGERDDLALLLCYSFTIGWMQRDRRAIAGWPELQPIEPIIGKVYYSDSGAEGWCPGCGRHFWDRIAGTDHSTLGRMYYVRLGRENGGVWGEFICRECAL